MNRHRLDLADIQANIVDALAQPCSHHLVVRIDDAQAARGLLTDASRSVTTAHAHREAKPDLALNVAISANGLARLGVPPTVIALFGEAFELGMAARAESLGDTGAGSPQRWEPGFAAGEAHLLLWLHTPMSRGLDTAVDKWRSGISVPGLHLVHDLRAVMHSQAHEHFGFADGYGQPSIKGVQQRPGRAVLPAGEFVLGHPDALGAVSPAGRHPLGRNGTMLVWRKLHQHVATFRAWTEARAGELGWNPEKLAAKMVGRWRDGAPMVLAPDDHHFQYGGNDALATDDFGYSADPLGVRCPIGAHARRANRRDGLAIASLSDHHRIIRRGMPYGPPLADDAPDDGVERGLMFACFNASITRQFEFIQQQWFNDGSRLGLADDHDPLVGARDGIDRFMVPGYPPRFVRGMPEFVHTRAGEYFLLPGCAALRSLAG